LESKESLRTKVLAKGKGKDMKYPLLEEGPESVCKGPNSLNSPNPFILTEYKSQEEVEVLYTLVSFSREGLTQ
jgi:hypothetical protein